MSTTTRLVGLSCIALGLAACGPRYEVFTCAFGSSASQCTPVRSSEEPKDKISMHFTLVNPNTQALACAGELELGVNAPKGGYFTWHAQEKDAATCAFVGEEMSGEQALDGTEKSVDAHFEQGAFTFRVVVRPEE